MVPEAAELSEPPSSGAGARVVPTAIVVVVIVVVVEVPVTVVKVSGTSSEPEDNAETVISGTCTPASATAL